MIPYKTQDARGRQERAVALLLAGMDNRAIAGQMNVSLRTVKNYLAKEFVYRKIRAKVKRVELAVRLTPRPEAPFPTTVILKRR
jgi:DNA-binding NarL/FixJ family response regulator